MIFSKRALFHISNKISRKKTGRQFVGEYAALMQTAPPLIVSSLSAPYRLLAEFNCIVLGGMRTEFGTQFATWAHRGDGLLFGHYCDNDYGAAKQDFVIRAGLVEKECVFSDNHLKPSVTA